jgi:hypothetical protein
MASLGHNRAREYRNRAEEARTKAEAARSTENRKSLLQVAETWDRMAQYEERHPSDQLSYYRPPSA